MDRMSLLDIIIVGIPEQALVFLLALLWVKGKENVKFTLDLIIKIIVEVGCILTGIYFIRIYFFTTLLCYIFSNFTIIIFLKIMFNLNNRQAVVGTFLSWMVITFSENITIPLFMVHSTLSEVEIFTNRFLFSLPTRVLQIILLIATLKYNIKINKKNIINIPWDILSLFQKINYFFFVFLLCFCNLLLTNYPAIIMKLTINNINYSLIFTNLYLSFVCITLFIMLVILMLNRTKKYNQLKECFYKSSDEVVADILENSSYEELHRYTKKFLKELYVVKTKKLYSYLNSLKNKYKIFTYKVDKNIVLCDCDYTTVMHLGEYFIEVISKEKINNNIIFKARKEENIIICRLFLYNSNEIQYKKLTNIFLKSNTCLKLIEDVRSTYNIVPVLSFKEEVITLNIDINIKK